MEVEKTNIEGVLVLKPRVFADDRGSFCESFSARTIKDLGIELDYPQDNQAVSKKNVVRGLHFQKTHPQAKNSNFSSLHPNKQKVAPFVQNILFWEKGQYDQFYSQ